MELKRGMTANLGFGISAMVPRILLEEGHEKAVTWAIEQGAVGGMPLTGFAFGCASNADAFVPSPNQFTYFQGGGFDMSFLSFLEVDVDGNVNVSKLGKKPYLTAGAAGSWTSRRMRRRSCSRGISRPGAQLDLTEDGLRVATPGKFTKMVDAVEHVTFAGQRALRTGQEVLYVTERCVMRLTESGLVATEIMPGIEPEEDIVQASEGRVRVAENAVTMPKSLLLADAPMGLEPMSSVDLHIEGPLARVHLNNPAKLNAFTPEMLRQLEAHCDAIEEDVSIRGVLVTAEGERAFCAGPTSSAGAR
jgi:propionate CoA-transferase